MKFQKAMVAPSESFGAPCSPSARTWGERVGGRAGQVMRLRPGRRLAVRAVASAAGRHVVRQPRPAARHSAAPPAAHQHQLVRGAPGAQGGGVVEQLDGQGDVGLHAVPALRGGREGRTEGIRRQRAAQKVVQDGCMDVAVVRERRRCRAASARQARGWRGRPEPGPRSLTQPPACGCSPAVLPGRLPAQPSTPGRSSPGCRQHRGRGPPPAQSRCAPPCS